MRKLILAALVGVVSVAAQADDIEDAIAAALAAYRAGDAGSAKDELDYALTLLGQAKARDLAAFLPDALAGWAREDDGTPAGMPGLFGAGMSALAHYVRGADRVGVQLIADNRMVASMGAMFGNPAILAGQGDVRRAGKQRYVVKPDGEIMALVDSRVLVQVTGSAPLADKVAYLEAIDFAALGKF